MLGGWGGGWRGAAWIGTEDEEDCDECDDDDEHDEDQGATAASGLLIGRAACFGHRCWMQTAVWREIRFIFSFFL